MNIEHWPRLEQVNPRRWTCSYCGRATGNNRGYKFQGNNAWFIYVCPACIRPTFFENDTQYPGASYGNMVHNLPTNLTLLYQEARNCMIVSAATAAVLTCRKILMHIAVEKGAKEGLSFQAYVSYLVTANIIPIHFTTWVDQIRQKSNEANHQLVVMDQQEAEDLLSFTEMLLKILYEYPSRVAAGT